MANYVLLQKVVVGQAGVTTVTFNSIPQTGYTDLKLVISARSSRSASIADGIAISFNGSTSSFSGRYMEGSSSSIVSGSDPRFTLDIPAAGSGASGVFSNSEIYIPNYTSANNKAIKSVSVDEDWGTSYYANYTATTWANTAAITSISLTLMTTPPFVNNSTFYLYGIAAAGVTPTKAPSAIGGDVIGSDGTYWYHAFVNNGAFTPRGVINCDVLVIGGGGGAGADSSSGQGAGGGAGGVVYLTNQKVFGTTPVIVGQGGRHFAANSGYQGGNGAPSAFGTLALAYGGGGGGAGNNSSRSVGKDGGSGGGGGGGVTYRGNGGASLSSQGSAGGNATIASASSNAGGGGGAGGTGGTGVLGANGGGAGGAGTNTYSTWLTATNLGVSGYIAGGGGGWSSGAAGSGGGGAGSNASGTINTGGGGGGYLGDGGKGLVIVRYLM